MNIPTYDVTDINSEHLKSSYFDVGCIIIKNAINNELVLSIRDSFIELFKEILEFEGVETKGNDIDELYLLVKETLSNEKSKYLLGIGKDFPSYLSLIGSEDILRVMRILFDTNVVQTVFDVNVFRIDEPQNSLTSLDWHQEYPYNMLSMNAATAWVPLLPVNEMMGSMKIILPKSELKPIEYDLVAKSEYHNPKYMMLKDLESTQDNYNEIATTVPDLEPGDLLILHALTLHRSGQNMSDKCRWVATARYGPFMDKELYDRNWFTARAKYPDIFKNHHPDLFSIKEQANDT